MSLPNLTNLQGKSEFLSKGVSRNPAFEKFFERQPKITYKRPIATHEKKESARTDTVNVFAKTAGSVLDFLNPVGKLADRVFDTVDKSIDAKTNLGLKQIEAETEQFEAQAKSATAPFEEARKLQEAFFKSEESKAKTQLDTELESLGIKSQTQLQTQVNSLTSQLERERQAQNQRLSVIDEAAKLQNEKLANAILRFESGLQFRADSSQDLINTNVGRNLNELTRQNITAVTKPIELSQLAQVNDAILKNQSALTEFNKQITSSAERSSAVASAQNNPLNNPFVVVGALAVAGVVGLGILKS